MSSANVIPPPEPWPWTPRLCPRDSLGLSELLQPFGSLESELFTVWLQTAAYTLERQFGPPLNSSQWNIISGQYYLVVYLEWKIIIQGLSCSDTSICCELLLDSVKLVSIADSLMAYPRMWPSATILLTRAFLIGGIFLTKDRHAQGTVQLPVLQKLTKSANAWIRKRLGELDFSSNYSDEQRQSIFPLLDFAEECESIRDILSLSWADYNVWQWLMSNGFATYISP